MYKGQVVLVGSSVGLPVGAWALVYGEITDVCESMCHAVVNVNGEELTVEAGKLQVVDSNLAGATLDEMTEGERSVIHNIWANPWIGFQVKVDGMWEDIPADARQEPFSSLMEDALLRVKPSEEYLAMLRTLKTVQIKDLKNKARL